MYRHAARRSWATAARASSRPAGRVVEGLESRVLFAAGDLDPSFSGDGKLAAPDAAFAREAVDVHVYADGKVLTFGAQTRSDKTDQVLTRYNADGTLDATFGSGGRAAVSFADRELGGAMAVGADGRFVVSGYTYGGTTSVGTLARLTPAGAPDTTFSGDGRLTLGAGVSIADLAVAADNRIVAVGGSGGNHFVAMRFTAAGAFDSTFSGDGKAPIDFAAEREDVARSVGVLPDGRVVAAGMNWADEAGGWDTDIVLARFRADGSLDPTFSGDGKAVTADIPDTPYGEEAFGLALQGDGKIVLAAGESFTVARYNPDGSPDRSFGGDGFASLPFLGGRALATEVSIAADGKILVGGGTVAGESWDSTLEDFAAARFNADGTVDTSFGSGGRAVTDFYGREDQLRAVAASPGGKVVAVGYAQGGDTNTDAVVRYNASGAPDTSFSGDGKLTGPVSGYSRRVDATAVQGDNKVVVVGTTRTGPNTDFFVARYTESGALDTSFSGDGIAAIDFGGRFDVALDVLVQPDGRIVVGGWSSGDLTRPEWQMRSDFAVARLNANGTLDTSFSGDGKVLSDFGGNEQAFDLARQADGGIIAGGPAGVVRYTAAGALDASFAGDGKADLTAAAVDAQGDKIVVAENHRLLRLNANGTPDGSFVPSVFPDGYDPEDDEPEMRLSDVVVTPDGKIHVAALDRYEYFREDRFAVLRFNPAGTADATFSGDGAASLDLPGVYLDDPSELDLAVQPDGKPVVAGIGQNEDSGDWLVITARYTASGDLDTGYGLGGRTLTEFGFVTDVAASPAGDVVVSTYAPTGTPGVNGYGLLRFDGAGDAGGITRDGDALTVTGNLTADTISLSGSGGTVTVTLNGVARSFTGIKNVQVYGRDGNDTITLGAGLPQPAPGGGNPFVTVDGGNGNDHIVGSAGAENLRGGAGDDYLDGGRGADRVFGDAGNDTVDYSSRTAPVGNAGEAGEGDELFGVEIYRAGSGDDRVSNFKVIYGGAGNDVLVGGAGANALWGEAGDDTLVNGADDAYSASGTSDYFRGGSGTDTVDYSESEGPVAVDIDGAADDGYAADGERDNVYTDVENVVGSVHGDRLTGSSGANLLLGNHGNDTIVGGGGSDLLAGGSDVDTVNGVLERDTGGTLNAYGERLLVALTAGADTLSVTRSGAAITVVQNGATRVLRVARLDGVEVDALGGNDRVTTGGPLRARVSGGEGNDTLVGGAGVDNFAGDLGNDSLSGGANVDNLDGGDGNDTLSGGDGNDWLTGGTNADVFAGGAGTDTASYVNHYAAIIVTLGSGDRDDGAAGERDNVGGDVENVDGTRFSDRLVGNGSNNSLYGAEGNDTLIGNGGDDVLAGGWGNDLMDGGLGSDRTFGGQDFDTVTYANRTENLVIDVDDNDRDDGAAGERDMVDSSNEEIIGGGGNDRITGDNNANTLRGGGGSDSLAGGGGNDLLVGDAGNDTLVGGGGRDRLYGRDGNDTLYARGDGAVDFLDGGSGTDKAQKDRDDYAQYVEQLLA